MTALRTVNPGLRPRARRRTDLLNATKQSVWAAATPEAMTQGDGGGTKCASMSQAGGAGLALPRGVLPGAGDAGLAVHATVDVAAGDSNAPVALLLPAMGVPAGFYDRFAEALAVAIGGAVCQVDLSGQGRSALRARRGDDYGYHEVTAHALPARVASLRQRFPRRPLFVVGHSVGGQLALLASARLEAELAGIVLIASGTAHHRAWPRRQRLKARLVTCAVSAAAWLLPWYPGRWLGFGGEQSRRWMRDWAHNALHGGYRLHRRDGSVETPRLERVRLPLLAVHIDGDAVAPLGALGELLALAPEAAAHRYEMRGVPGDGRWRRHFSWARQPGEAVCTCAHWISIQANTFGRDALLQGLDSAMVAHS